MADDIGTSVDPPAQGKAKGGKVDVRANLTQQMMANPEIMAALAKDMDLLRGRPSTYIESMPEVIKRRIRALKNIQVDCQQVEARFFAEVQALERRFAAQYKALYDQRREIVIGKYEPKESETHFAPDEEDEEEEEEDNEDGGAVESGVKVLDDSGKPVADEDDGAAPTSQYDEKTKGIPEFWLTAMKNSEPIASTLEEHDEEVLQHLEDVSLQLTENPLGFILEFHFSENEFFSNSVLKKTYNMKLEVDETDPWRFEGPEITSSEGCEINWKKGKNVTVKTIKKKQKNKNKGQTRISTKQVRAESFFNFFSPPAAPEDDEELEDEEAAEELGRDFEIGTMFRDNLIPRAVLYFTGEALQEDDDDYMEGEDGDDYDMDDDDDEAADPDFQPAPGGYPKECSQQ